MTGASDQRTALPSKTRRPVDLSLPRALRIIAAHDNAADLANACHQALTKGEYRVETDIASYKTDEFHLVIGRDKTETRFQIRPFNGGPFDPAYDARHMVETLHDLFASASPDLGSSIKDRAAAFLLTCTLGSQIWSDENSEIPNSMFSHRAWDDGLPTFTIWDRNENPITGRHFGPVPESRLPNIQAIHACAAEFPANLTMKWLWDAWHIQLDDPTSSRKVRPMPVMEAMRILSRHRTTTKVA